MKYQPYYGLIFYIYLTLLLYSCHKSNGEKQNNNLTNILPPVEKTTVSDDHVNDAVVIDTALFNLLQVHLVHGMPNEKWPVKSPYPLPGAILPYNRVVAFYGNFYSKGMGILGELPQDEMMAKLMEEVEVWVHADTVLKVMPALHYIAVTAQSAPGRDRKYRLRMPFHQVDKALQLSRQAGGILFLDVQVGHSTLQEELPLLEEYLKLPDVHLGIDPEYSMKHGEKPASTLGYFDAADVNYASSFLTELVKKYNLPPKVLVVHRFTREMVTGYKNIDLRPEVQIVMHMDGFGYPAKKINSYRVAIVNEPVQFTGFKLFYKNDKLTPPYRLMQPEEILKLNPRPVYIQYQ